MNYRRLVIKVGTHVLTQDGTIAKSRMLALVTLIVKLKEHNIEVILVSSGAVGAGYLKLPLDRSSVENRQALAAIGQPFLMRMYNKIFVNYGVLCSQVLIRSDLFDSRQHTSHAKNAIDTLLANKVVPIINENDTVSIEELVFGDNDRLSAHAAYYFGAQLLVILSDIDAYYDKDPHAHSDAVARDIVSSIAKEELNVAHTPNNEFATGGIVTKLQSADFLMRHNLEMFLGSGFNLDSVESFLLNGVHKGGTIFKNNE
jgi:glutamate 5-kinase